MAIVTKPGVFDKNTANARKSRRAPLQETRDFTHDQQMSFAQAYAAQRDLPREFGRYRILKKLGQGGMGAVYLAEDTVLLRKVALKTPSIASDVDNRSIRRFLREARAAATIHHPNVCPIFDVGKQDERYYLTMAYIRGCTLAEWKEKKAENKDQVEPYDALRIIRQLALGLQEAHDAGVVHRDVKPGNVMMTPRHEPVIIDFGTVRLLASEDVSQSFSVAGTPAYMAPEQISGEHECGPSVDVYSLGVILYELLTGKPPFEGSVTTLIGAIVCDPPPAPASIADLDPKLDELCLRALAKLPQQRYASPADFAAAIDGYLAGR